MQWSWILGRQVREGEEDAADDVPESPSKGDNGLKGGTTTVTSADSAATETGSSGGEKDTTESGTTKQKNVIDFDPSNVPSADPVIRPITGVTDSQTFRWRPDNGSVSVDRIMWRGRTSEDESFKNIATSKKPSTGDYPDDGPLSDVTRESASLAFEDFLDDDGEFADYRTHDMVLKIEWTVKEDGIDRAGYTETSPFTIAKVGEDVSGFEEVLRDIQKAIDDGVRDIVNEVVGENRAGEEDAMTRALPTSTATTSTIAPTMDTDDGDGGGGGGGGGLSTGAIAGIAVAGAVVFLGLTGGLIFFFLRRRRRTKERGRYNNPDNSTTFMAGDKEVHHQVTESPHSTYSNDQQVPLSTLNVAENTSRDAAGPSGQHHDHHHHHDHHSDDDDAGYVPYRDEDAAPASPASGRARDDGAGTPHGVSRSVAHLVEDGMTEDEIRRLEDEERQLDDAIQRRGQR